MKLNKKLTLVLFLIMSLVTPMQATTLNKPLELEDVFTTTNIGKTISINHSTAYMITNTGTVKVVGDYPYGNGDTTFPYPSAVTSWQDVITGPTGALLEDIVKLKAVGSRGALFLDTEGYVWITGSVTNNQQLNNIPYAVKLEDYSNIVDIAGPTGYKAQTTCAVGYVLLDADGRTYVVDRQNSVNYNGETFMEDGSPTRFKRIFGAYMSRYYTAIDEQGRLCAFNPSTNKWQLVTVDGQPISEVKEIAEHATSAQTIILTNDGKALSVANTLTPENTSVTRLLVDDNTDILVHDISDMQGATSYGRGPFIQTDLGQFSTYNGISNPYSYLPITSVNMSFEYNTGTTSHFYLSNEGYICKVGNTVGSNVLGFSDSSANIQSTEAGVQYYRLPWMNDNPILGSSLMARVNIPTDKIYANIGEVDISFSIIPSKPLKSFNLYYIQDDAVNHDNWKVIEKHINISSLQTEIYETGHSDSKGNAITGYTYTYKWKYPDSDLRNIRIIVEPIY